MKNQEISRRTMLRVAATGGIFVMDDMRETPDTLFNCPGHTLTYSMRHTYGWRMHDDLDHGIEFFGGKATLLMREYREPWVL